MRERRPVRPGSRYLSQLGSTYPSEDVRLSIKRKYRGRSAVTGRVLLSLLLVLIAAAGAASELQLCIAANGHLEFERRGDCNQHEADALPPPSSNDSVPDDCDPCTDYVLGSESVDAFTAPQMVELRQPVYTTDAISRITERPLPRPLLGAFPFSLPEDGRPTLLRALRSVVLLI